MKKRMLSILMMLVLAMSLVACGEDNNRTSDEVTTQDSANQDAGEDVQEDTSADAADAVSILVDVWAVYGENDKFYGMGGDANNMVENAPGAFSLEDKDALAATLLVQADAAGMIDEAASLVHGMNLNIFTGGAYHLTDAANMQAFADAMKNSILNNQWMCGSPDQYVIYSVNGEYAVVAFGAVDVMNVFKQNFTSVHGENAEVVVEGNVAQ